MAKEIEPLNQGKKLDALLAAIRKRGGILSRAVADLGYHEQSLYYHMGRDEAFKAMVRAAAEEARIEKRRRIADKYRDHADAQANQSWERVPILDDNFEQARDPITDELLWEERSTMSIQDAHRGAMLDKEEKATTASLTVETGKSHTGSKITIDFGGSEQQVDLSDLPTEKVIDADYSVANPCQNEPNQPQAIESTKRTS